MMHLTKQHYGVLAAVLLVGVGAGFCGGAAYQRAKGPRMMTFDGRNMRGSFGAGGPEGGAQGGAAFFSEGGAQGGRMMAGRGRAFGGAATGEILSVGDASFTVKLPDGGSRIVLFSDKTAITKSDKADKSVLKPGVNVFVGGEANADGSVTAATVMLREAAPAPAN